MMLCSPNGAIIKIKNQKSYFRNNWPSLAERYIFERLKRKHKFKTLSFQNNLLKLILILNHGLEVQSLV